MRILMLAVALLATWCVSAEEEQATAPLLITGVTTDVVVLYNDAFDEVGRLSRPQFRDLFFEDAGALGIALPEGIEKAVAVVAPVNPALRMYGVLDKRPAAVAEGLQTVVYVEGNSVTVSSDAAPDKVCPPSVRALVAEPQRDVTTGFGGCGAAEQASTESAAR